MRRSCLVLGALLLMAAPTHAQVDETVTLNLYIGAPDYAGCGSFDDAEVALCSNLASPPHPGTSFLWVVVSDTGGWPQGIDAIQFGVEWAGLQVQGWSLCTGGLQIPQTGWPASGTGNAMTWAGDCYEPPSEVAKVGYFTIDDGSIGSMLITGDPRLSPPQTLFTYCNSSLAEICEGNRGGASLMVGTDPICGDNCDGSTPTHETSWSDIKERYR